MLKNITRLMGTFGIVYVMFNVFKSNNAKSIKDAKTLDTFKRYYNLLNEWMYRKNAGIQPVDYLNKNNMADVIIYGVGTLGQHLYDELSNSNINVKFFIDAQNMGNIKSCKVISKNEISKSNISQNDTIIVTPINAYKEIKKELKNKVCCKIISLEEVIYQC